MQVTSKQMQLRHCVTGPTEGTSSSVPPVAAVGLAPSSLLDAMVVLSFFTFAASPKHTAPGVGLLYYTYSSSLRCVHHTLMLRAGEICLFNMYMFIQPARSIFLAACAHWPLFLGWFINVQCIFGGFHLLYQWACCPLFAQLFIHTHKQ